MINLRFFKTQKNSFLSRDDEIKFSSCQRLFWCVNVFSSVAPSCVQIIVYNAFHNNIYL